jgi:phosphatidylserine decarboxylase
VVLEGQWKEGFAAIAAVGATNVGSIKVLSLSLSLSLTGHTVEIKCLSVISCGITGLSLNRIGNSICTPALVSNSWVSCIMLNFFCLMSC